MRNFLVQCSKKSSIFVSRSTNSFTLRAASYTLFLAHFLAYIHVGSHSSNISSSYLYSHFGTQIIDLISNTASVSFPFFASSTFFPAKLSIPFSALKDLNEISG